MPPLHQYHFPGQHENEVVLKVIHRHWFVIAAHLATVLLVSCFLLGSLGFIPSLFPEVLTEENWRFFLFAQHSLLIFVWLYSFLVWIDYYFDVWIITSERIVNIEQRGLFTRRISELRFSRIQDVTSAVNGLLPTILNFGDVFVQTAAEEERFTFRQVGDPFAVKDEIMSLARKATTDDMKILAEAIEKKG
jgi:uncharacterized membrane protein YdbT with pleckstrin-like domain